MTDKDKYPILYKAIQATIEGRTRWLQEALRADLLCDSLPDEIKAMSVSAVDYDAYNGLQLHIEAGQDTVRTLKLLGIHGLKPKVSSWSNKNFWTTGTGKLPDGTPLSISVDNIEAPEDCEVVEKTHTSKEYVLVCAKTGEEIK